MAYDANWPRWVFISVSNYFRTAALAEGYPVLIDEIDERTTSFMEKTNRLEIRVTGPTITEKSANCWYFQTDANILIHSCMGGQLSDRFVMVNMAGVMAKAADGPIPVYKYGNGVDDDQSLLGCLTLRKGRGEGVKIHHFGEIDRDNRLRQMGIDVEYNMYVNL